VILHNEKLRDSYRPTRRLRWAGHVNNVNRMGETKKVYKTLMGKPLGRPRSRILGDVLKECEVDGIGSGSCPMAGSGISAIDFKGSPAIVLFMVIEIHENTILHFVS